MKISYSFGKLRFIALLYSLFICSIIFSQKNEYFKIADNCLISKNEKVYVQLDKQCYISGESLNFNAVVLNASKLNTEGVSEEVYFEVMDNNNKPVMDWHCNAINGSSSGSVIVPDSVSFGIYTLKAYTNWMRNFSADLYFSKEIIITRLNDKMPGFIPYSVPENKEQLISFFPEGGNLIDGFETKVAYRIDKMDSSLINKLCIIKDNDSTIISQFNISDNGLGSFSLNPVSGKKYYAEIQNIPDIKKSLFDLPKSYPNGFLLKVQNTGNMIRVSVNTKDAFQNEEKLKLTAITRGVITFDSTISSRNPNIQIGIETKRFPSGITEFMLVKGNYIINHRYIYIKPDETSSVSLNLSNTIFSTGEKVNLDINISEPELNPVSVTITEVPHFTNLMSNYNLIRYMYFDSELTGVPATIRNSDNISENEADLVLLTSSYDQYAWNLYQKSECVHLKENSGYILKGELKKKSTKEPISGALITMSCIDSVSTLKYCYTDKNGVFLFLLDDYYDNKDVVFQIYGYARTQNDIEWVFEDKDGRSGESVVSTYEFTSEELSYLTLNKNIGLVDKVFKPKQKKTLNINSLCVSRKGNFYGTADAIVRPADFSELLDFDEIAANIVPDIKFRGKGEKSSIQVYNNLNHELIPENAFVILNGIPYDDLGYISTLGTNQIQRIEIVQSTIMYGDVTCSGIVSIFTHNNKIPDNYYNSSKFIYRNEIKSTPLIDFSNNNNSQNEPNLKQILYWNPAINVNEKTTIAFNTSDIKGKFKISVKGVTKTGKLIEKNAIIEVK